MAAALLGRDAAGEQVVDLVDGRNLAPLCRRRLLELAVPPLELTFDVALAAAEVAEADGVDVDGVERGQDVDEIDSPATRRCASA